MDEKPSKPKPASDADRLFAEEYLVDFSATAAFVRAFPDKYHGPEIHRQAYYWLAKPQVKKLIADRIDETLVRVGITVENTLREISRNAFADPRNYYNPDGTIKPIHELTADAASAIASFECEETVQVKVENEDDLVDGPKLVEKILKTKVKKLKLADRFKYLELLVKYQKLIVDKLEITGANGGAVQVNLYIPDNKRGE